MDSFKGFSMPAPQLASDKYAAEHARKFASGKGRGYRCTNGCVDEDGYQTKITRTQYYEQQGLCNDCLKHKRALSRRVYGKRKAYVQARVIGEAHAQLSGEVDRTERCVDCKLPQKFCKCGTIERERSGKPWWN